MPAPVQLNMLEVIYIRLSPYIILVPCTFLQLMNNEIIERQVKETMPKKKLSYICMTVKKHPNATFSNFIYKIPDCATDKGLTY